jgi:DNA-binding PadR family transcriptional regulator
MPPTLRQTNLLILTMLTGGERHGYGIRQDIVEHTEGRVRLEAGNLYRSIGRLLDEGLIEESPRRPPAESDDERRRYYRLTASGKRTLGEELRQLRALVRVAERNRLVVPERGQ